MTKLLALVSAIVSCAALAQQPQSPASGFADRLAAATQRWHDAAIADYVYGFNKFCECHRDTPPETLVTVADARITDVRHVMAKTGDTVPAAASNFSLYWTIEDLFVLLDRAVERGATVQADFDAELGAPRRVFIDYLPEIVGDELDVRVTRFEPR